MLFGNVRIRCAGGMLLCALLHGQQVRLVNVIPNSQSGEIGRDSEPSIAVNPSNPQQIAISSFTRDPGGSADVPLFLSTDGGINWTLSVPVVPGSSTSTCVATICDITLRFATTSNRLYTAALDSDSATSVTTYRITRITNTFGVPTTDALRTRTGTGTKIPDQPYIEANTVLGGGGTGNDRLSVPFNDLTVFPGQTATMDRTLNAVPPAPAGFAGFVAESRPTTGQDSPPVRSAVHASGVVYAAFTGHRAGGNEIVVARDDNWGTGPAAFQAISDADGNAGIRVVTGLTQTLGTMGTQRTGSPLSIAVHPDDSQTVYVVYCEGSTTANFTVHVRRSITGGATWSPDLFTATSVINPSIAVTARGEVGLLFQQLVTASSTFATHFILSNDGSFTSPTDILLANVPTASGAYAGSNPIGDYTGLMAVGKTFYGVFSANNTPATANFHSSISFLRNANFGTQTLTNLGGTAVGVSVDPFFFSVTRTDAPDDFYTRDWSNSPTSHDEGQEPSTDPVFYVNSDVWSRRSNTSGAFDPGTDRPDHQDPMEAAAGHNFAFVRVYRKAAAAGGAPDVPVTARFLVADYGLGTNYQNADPAPMPVLTFAAAETQKSLTDGQGYQWDLAATHSTHICMAVQLESANDPPASTLVGHAVGWPTTDLMILNDNNKSQRNMGVYTGPVGGTDTVTFYAQIHNAATFRRDMLLHYELDPRIARLLRVSRVEIAGRSENSVPAVPQNGATLTLKAMQPGETRWIGVSLVAPAAKAGQFVQARLTEVSSGVALNGIELGVRPAEIGVVIRENLLLHAGVLNRFAALFHMEAAGRSAQEALQLSRKPAALADYVAFLQGTRELLAASTQEALALVQPASDVFAVKLALTRLNKAVDLGKANTISAAHAGLLFKLDALASSIDKQRGDAADILQNVYWQRELYGKSAKLRAIAAEVTRGSTDFIRAFEANKTDQKSFAQLIARLNEPYQKAAATLGDAELKQLATALARSGGSAQDLQKRHRDFLLRLQDLTQ